MSKTLVAAAVVASVAAYTPEAMLNATASCPYQATCTANGYTGVCVDSTTGSGCCNGGTFTSGLCPGANNIKCCTTPTCTVGGQSGQCMEGSQCTGSFTSGGGCTGPTGFGCCVGGTPKASVYGVDLYAAISSSTASCFASSYGFIIPRGFRSNGQVDTNVCTTLTNSKNAGIQYRDSYMFPCPTCSASASSQVQTMVNYINSNCKSSWSGRVWLDIEGSEYWLGSTSSNKNWYQQLVDACNQYASSCGVYTSSSQWSELFGSSSYSYGSNLPLWYAHYDNNPSFSDYKPFGGWSSPYMKQYAGDVTVCSQDVDKNYCPSM